MQDQAVPEITPEMLEQNPGLLFMFVLVMLVVFLGGLASLASWGWLTYRIANGGAILPLSHPWRPRLWSLLDLVIIIGVVFVVQGFLVGIALQFIDAPREDSPSLEIIAAGGMASLLGVLLGSAWIEYRYKQGREHLGFGPISWKKLLSAMIVGVATLPVIYLLMMIVSALTRTEYEHPLINSASESGTLLSYLLGCFAAVIAAPIAEEFLFRVILQGWLQSLPFKSLGDSLVGTSNVAALMAARSKEGGTSCNEAPAENYRTDSVIDIEPEKNSPTEPKTTDWNSVTQLSSNPYAPVPLQDDLQSSGVGGLVIEHSEGISEYRTPTIPPLWPAVVAGVLFGFAHFDYGWSCVPLSVLGIVLGLIYRQTHSVWPCILIHALLNSLAMLMLGLMILIQQATR